MNTKDLNLSFELGPGFFELSEDGSSNGGLEEQINDSLSFPGQGRSSASLAYQLNIIDVLKTIAMVLVMVAAVFGNALVILSVFRFERLRIIANYFIVSLAFADSLVAILVMSFNASQEIAGKWVFGRVMCDIWNANDVLFCTASLLHICCISMDRYIAILDPFHYESKMTKRRAVIMLVIVWSASALISHVPIQMGWYTTQKQKITLELNSEECTFFVNKVYAAVSSSISFWIPASIMVFTYVKIYREARRQEKAIYHLTVQAGASADRLTVDHVDNNSNGTSNNTLAPQHTPQQNNNRKNGRPPPSPQTNRRLNQDRRKMKREHKAAKTLGIIMGAFLCCWLPFFIWYIVENMCDVCSAPELFIKFLFWIGYCNSALNPVIYAFFSRDFRNAFKRILHIHKVRSNCCSWCCCCCGGCASCRGCRSEKDSLARYGAAEMQSRTTPKTDQYNYSSSTPSPRSRRYYDPVDAV